MITALWLACSVFLAPPAPGENLLPNPGFETDAAWQVFAGPLTFDDQVAHSGRRSLRLSLPPGGDSAGSAGAQQTLVFDPPLAGTVRIAGWAKAQDAVVQQDFSIYCDAWFADGSPLWGQNAVFPPGTYDWRRVVFEFTPRQPLARLLVVPMLRLASGTVWFDDLEVCRAPLDWLTIEPRLGAYGGRSVALVAQPSRAAQWAARLEAGGRTLAEAQGVGGTALLDWQGDAPRAELVLTATDAATGETGTHREQLALDATEPRRALLLGVADSQERVLPSALPRGGLRPVALAVARGEAESFQVLLRAAPGHELRGLRLSGGELRGPRQARLAAPSWQQVGYVWIDRLRGHQSYPEARPGWWPDALLPVEQFDLAAGFTQSLWVTVRAPADQPPGVYRGEVVLAGPAGELGRVPLTLTVQPFTLPARPSLKTAFALMDGFLERIYGAPLAPEIRRRYGDFVLEHRLAADDISRTDPPQLTDLAVWQERQSAFNVLNLVQRRGPAVWVCYSELDWYTPAHIAELRARLDDYVPRLKAAGLAEQAYVYTFDERGEEFYPTIREVFGLVKERYGLPTLTTARLPLDPEVLRDLNVDWACPLTPAYDRDRADACRAAGQQVWAYVCLGPGYPYANWLADFPLIEARVFMWQAFDQRLDGVLYWGLNIWDLPGNDKPIDPGAGPLLDWRITTGWEYDWLHGDGRLLYAGPEGPIGSIRLANLRDGLEDYEVLRLAAAADAERTAAALARVTTGWTTFTRDPATVRAARAQLARIIAAR